MMLEYHFMQIHADSLVWDNEKPWQFAEHISVLSNFQ